jgi:hypothetical protein
LAEDKKGSSMGCFGYVVIAGLVMLLFVIIMPKIAGTDSNIPKEDPNKSAAMTAIRAEPKVMDAYVTEANVLYVQVKDDGTRRDGYASYLCQVLKENHSSVDRVKVVKAGSQNDPKRDNAYGILLGESWCK